MVQPVGSGVGVAAGDGSAVAEGGADAVGVSVGAAEGSPVGAALGAPVGASVFSSVGEAAGVTAGVSVRSGAGVAVASTTGGFSGGEEGVGEPEDGPFENRKLPNRTAARNGAAVPNRPFLCFTPRTGSYAGANSGA